MVQEVGLQIVFLNTVIKKEKYRDLYCSLNKVAFLTSECIQISFSS